MILLRADWSIFHDHFINNFFALEFAVAINLPNSRGKFSLHLSNLVTWLPEVCFVFLPPKDKKKKETACDWEKFRLSKTQFYISLQEHLPKLHWDKSKAKSLLFLSHSSSSCRKYTSPSNPPSLGGVGVDQPMFEVSRVELTTKLKYLDPPMEKYCIGASKLPQVTQTILLGLDISHCLTPDVHHNFQFSINNWTM